MTLKTISLRFLLLYLLIWPWWQIPWHWFYFLPFFVIHKTHQFVFFSSTFVLSKFSIFYTEVQSVKTISYSQINQFTKMCCIMGMSSFSKYFEKKITAFSKLLILVHYKHFFSFILKGVYCLISFNKHLADLKLYKCLSKIFI